MRGTTPTPNPAPETTTDPSRLVARQLPAAPSAGGSRRRLLSLVAAGALGVPLAVAGLAGLTFAKDDDRDDDDDHDDDHDDDSGHGRGRGRGRGRGGDRDAAEAAAAGPPADLPPGAILVEILDDDNFTPSRLTIDAGQTVAFVNYDGDDHTATGSAFDTGIIPEQGGFAVVTLETPGRFPFACLIHPEMVGEIAVRDANGNVPERAAASPVAAGAQSVSIANVAFSPATLTVAAGEAVVWTNNDQMPHTVTARDGLFDSGILDPGATFSWTFADAGTVGYVCSLHPGMAAEIVVDRDASAPVQTTPAPAASTPAPAALPATTEHVVEIIDVAFSPATITIPLGATVVWTNADPMPHTVTGDTVSSPMLDPGMTFSHTFDTAGTHAYFCAVHPSMEAEVIVEG